MCTTPKAPPAPPPPPEAPRAVDAATVRSTSDRRRRAGSGHQSTIMTSPMGVQNGAQTFKTVLGG